MHSLLDKNFPLKDQIGGKTLQEIEYEKRGTLSQHRVTESYKAMFPSTFQLIGMNGDGEVLFSYISDFNSTLHWRVTRRGQAILGTLSQHRVTESYRAKFRSTFQLIGMNGDGEVLFSYINFNSTFHWRVTREGKAIREEKDA